MLFQFFFLVGVKIHDVGARLKDGYLLILLQPSCGAGVKIGQMAQLFPSRPLLDWDQMNAKYRYNDEVFPASMDLMR